MKVQSVNIARPTQINWKGKTEVTGIFKTPVSGPIHLGEKEVAGDTIANKKVHGGPHKACYLYSTRHYPYWKKRYPGLDWNWGMFGENISVEGMDERVLQIGDTFRIGGALIQLSLPREPCYKLGVRFGTQNILKEFITYGFPGSYARVLKEGTVQPGDQIILEERLPNPLTVWEFFDLLFQREKSQELVRKALENNALPQYKKDKIKKFL